MDLVETITVGVQIAAIAVLIAMGSTLYRAAKIEPFMRGRPGGGLMKIIVGVILGFTIAQLVAVMNVFGILILDSYQFAGFHNSLRLAQQVIAVITCIWAWRRLAKFL